MTWNALLLLACTTCAAELWERQDLNVPAAPAARSAEEVAQEDCGGRQLRDVPKYNWDISTPFAAEAAAAREPLVLRGAEPSQWSAMRKWARGGFLQRRAPERILARAQPCLSGSGGSGSGLASPGRCDAFTLRDDSADAARGRQWLVPANEPPNAVRFRNMTWQEFVDAAVTKEAAAAKAREGGASAADTAAAAQGAELLYFTSPLSEWGDLAASVSPRTLLSLDEGGLHKQTSGGDDINTAEAAATEDVAADDEGGNWTRSMVWVAHAGARAQLHYDKSHNFLVQVLGFKTVHLFPPAAFGAAHLFASIHPSRRQSQRTEHRAWETAADEAAAHGRGAAAEHRRAADGARFPLWCNRAAAAEAGLPPFHDVWRVVLAPGDMLYIPPFWFHEVLSHSASASFGKRAARNLTQEAADAAEELAAFGAAAAHPSPPLPLTLNAAVSVLSPSVAEATFGKFYWQPVPLGAVKLTSTAERAAGALGLLRLLLRALLHADVVVAGLTDFETIGGEEKDAEAKAAVPAATPAADKLPNRFLRLLYTTRYLPLLPRGLAGVETVSSDPEIASCFFATGNEGSKDAVASVPAYTEAYARIEGALAAKADKLVATAQEVFGSDYLLVPVRAVLMMDYTEELLRWAVGPNNVGKLLELCTRRAYE